MKSLLSIFKSHKYSIFLIFFLALLPRIILIANPGFEADVSFWKSWGLAPLDAGIVKSFSITNNNYPTPFAYLLWAMVKVYSLFADPHNFNEYWRNTNLTFLIVSKVPSIIADYAIAILILLIGKLLGKPTDKKIQDKGEIQGTAVPSKSPFGFYIFLSAVYLFNPLSLIDGAWWGQVDAIGVAIFLLAFYLALSDKPLLSGFVYMTAVLMKLQNMIYGPLFFAFIWLRFGGAGLMRAVAGSLVSFFFLNIEFFFSRNMEKVLASLTDNFDYFPFMSLNAYNLWWIVAKTEGMSVSDKIAGLGIANAQTVGLALFSALYLFSMLHLIWPWMRRFFRLEYFIKHERPHEAQTKSFLTAGEALNLNYRFITGLVVIVSAFFLFQTQSHERYMFPAIIFLLLWLPFYLADKNKYEASSSWYKTKRFKLFTFLFSLFTLLYFYNIHTSLVRYYPWNGLPGLSLINQPQITIGVSVLLLVLFGVFFWTILPRYEMIVYVIPALFVAFMLINANLPILLKKPVSLNKIKPITSWQEYGRRMTNMPANASFGFQSWSPLSVQYAFYRSGIGTHATSVIEYDINRAFRMLTFDYGIDTQAGSQGKAVFEIYGDGKKLFTSDQIGRYDMPQHAQVNVTGVKKLGLVTAPGDNGNTDDHTDWLNPMLWP